MVRGTVEETLNALLDAEADRLCNQRYERSAARRDTHLVREGRMTVTSGRRELLAALGGASGRVAAMTSSLRSPGRARPW